MGVRGRLASAMLAMTVAAACSSFTGDPPSTPTDAGATPPTADAGGPTSDAGPPLDAPSGCPSPMIKQTFQAWTFCIDPTEVTESAYLAVRSTLSASALAALQQDPRVPEPCRGLGSLDTGSLASSTGVSALPVVKVGFCSAAVFCVAQGKRLCGSITNGGGPVTKGGGLAGLQDNEWYQACTKGGLYPTSAPSDVDAGCRLGLRDDAGPGPVGSIPSCGHDGMVDLVGNVSEWLNERNQGATASYTRVAGGDFTSGKGTDCNVDFGADGPKDAYAGPQDRVGFRCCATP